MKVLIHLRYDVGVDETEITFSFSKEFSSNNPMIKHTDNAVIIFIAVLISTVEALIELFSIIQKGIFIDQKIILMKKTNKELRAMLKGVKKISSLNKNQLVDLLVQV